MTVRFVPCTRAMHALHTRCALIGAGCRLISARHRLTKTMEATTLNP